VQSLLVYGISNLESIWASKLFDRSSTPAPTLTPEGERLLRSAKALFSGKFPWFEKIAESILRKEESGAPNSRGRAHGILLISAQCVAALSYLRVTFPMFRLDLVVSGFPRYHAHLPVADGMSIWRVFSDWSWINRVSACVLSLLDCCVIIARIVCYRIFLYGVYAVFVDLISFEESDLPVTLWLSRGSEHILNELAQL